MVSQHQLFGMGIEIDLVADIWNIIDSYVVSNKSQRHDEWNEFSGIVIDHFTNILLFARPEMIAQKSENVL